MKRTVEYRTWLNIVQRCTNPKATSFPNYGARGVTVAAEWTGEGGFERFLAHIGPKPSRAHSIDRIENDRGYEPGNVRWATRLTQNRNRTTTMLLTLNGRTQTATEWAEELGIQYNTIRARRAKGWSDEQVLTRPVGRWAGKDDHAQA